MFIKKFLCLALLGFASNFADASSCSLDRVVVGQTFLARGMDPTDGSNSWSLVSHGVAEKLFTVDKNDEIVPQIAESVEKISDLVWEVTIKEGYKFSDGSPVDASHVAESLNDLNAKNSNAQSSLGTMTVTVVGDLKVQIESERSTHVMDAVLAEWVFAIFTKDANGVFLFTGPYAIETFGGEAFELVPNRYYDIDSLKRPLITLQKFADGEALAAAAIAGEIDIGFHLPIDTLQEVRKADGVGVKSFEVGYQYMMFHNLDSIDDVNVRKAIDLAIDRTVLSQALSGGTATRSLFPDYSPYFSDASDLHGDSKTAAQLLDEAGWELNSDGKRAKDGEILSVHLVAYPHRPGLGIMQPLIADSLEAVGFTVKSTLTGMDWDETQGHIDGRTFDLLLWAQHTLPAGDPMWFLSAFFRTDGGNNHSNLASASVDTMLDDLSLTEDHQDRVAMTASTQAEILGNVPVSSLVTPFWHVSLSDKMADYEPWGSDYYVIRADLMPVCSEADDHNEPDSHDHSDHDSHDHSDHDSHDDESAGVARAATGAAAVLATAVLLA